MRLPCVLGALGALALAAPAQAARLEVQLREVWQTDPYYYYLTYRDVSFQAANPAADQITVTGLPSGAVGVVLTDPGVPITTAPPRGPHVNLPGDGPPYAADWQCFTPGVSVGTCVATPGFVCAGDFGGCENLGGGFFNGVLRVQSNGGADTVTIAQPTMPANIGTGSGNDTVDVRNSVRDVVDCGDGADTVNADPVDLVRDNCETVVR